MVDIFHTLTINAPKSRVFDCISSPKGLDSWWTKTSKGKSELGAAYELYFEPQYNWKGIVTKYNPGKEFELKITDAHTDWINTKVGFILKDKDGITEVSFYHSDWQQNNEHYRISCYCWAMYLRTLKRYIEYGEQVPYEQRLTV